MALLPCSSVWAFTIKQTPNYRCDRATSERADWPSSQEDAAERGNLYIFINERKCIILLSQGNDIQRNLTAMEPQYRVLSMDCKSSLTPAPLLWYHKRESFSFPDFFFTVTDILLALKVRVFPIRARYFQFFLHRSVSQESP
jgi:hypothetical protein